MARRLQPLVLDLRLTPDLFELHNGDAVGNMPRSSGVSWDIAAPGNQVGNSLGGAGWSLTWSPGELFTARARLTPDARGKFQTDTDYDTGANGPRTAKTPTMSAAGCRSWLGLELWEYSPNVAAVVKYRLNDGSTDLYWTGSAWASATDPAAHWNTAQDVQDNVGALAGTVRALAVVAWLSTTDSKYTPEFYGARVLYGVRRVSGLDDGLIRTLLAELRAELRVTTVAEWTTTDTVTVINLGTPVDDGSTAGAGASEWTHDVTDVEAVFNLTADPDELSPLSGTWDSGAKTWTPDTPIASGQVVRLELEHRPHLVVRRSREALAVEQLHSVTLFPQAAGAARVLGLARQPVRDRFASPPTAQELPAPDRVTVPILVEVLAGLGADVERIGAALRTWLGESGYRRLVSPESAQVIDVRQVQPLIEVPDLLGSGLAEVRGTWLLSFSQATADAVVAANTLRSGGLNVTPVEG